jgi:hypothetical protein
VPHFPAIPAYTPISPVRAYGEETAPAQTFIIGAAVYLDANGLVAECPVDPATILGFAQTNAGKNPLGLPYAGAASPAALSDLVAVAQGGTAFWMSCVNAPQASDVNKAFGITKGADGIWQVDQTKVVNTRVFVEYVDLDRNLELVTVLQSNRQAAP